MDWTQIVVAFIGVLEAVLTVVLTTGMNKISKKQTESEAKADAERAEMTKRAELRKRESWLNMEMTLASIDLAEVSANALTNGHNNGNVEKARQKVEEVRQKYTEFQNEVMHSL